MPLIENVFYKMLNFNNIDVIVNGTGIVAESASIDNSNNTTPAYSLGYGGVFASPQTGPIINKINLSYLLELGTESNFAVVNDIKNNPTGHTGINISLANLTGINCYLNSYQLSIIPNDTIRANVSYTTFRDITGSLGSKNPNTRYTTGKFGHSWSTSLSPSLLELSYGFQVDWEPVYIIGSGNKPVDVLFNGANESFEVISEQVHQIKHSGQPIEESVLFTSPINAVVTLYPQEWINNTAITNPSLNLNMSGAYINSQTVNAGLDDIVRVKMLANKYY